MGNILQGALIPADIISILDYYGGLFKAQYTSFGLGLSSESSSNLANKAITLDKNIIGDGTIAGIKNQRFKSVLMQPHKGIIKQTKYPVYYAQLFRQIITLLDNDIRQQLPAEWNYKPSSSGERYLDLELMRVNAASPNRPAKPTGTPTLTATTGGNLASITGSGRPRMKYTFCYKDATKGIQYWNESIPSDPSAQTDISGLNSAYTVGAIQNPIPTGVGAIKVYRQKYANAGVNDPYYYDQVVLASAGSAPPAITLIKSDTELWEEYQPPAYMSAMMLPESAYLYAIPMGSIDDITGLVKLAASQVMSSPQNVALNPANGFLGQGNQPATGVFARWLATAFSEGSIRRTNDYTNLIQGFYGAINGIRARTVSALASDMTITSFDYWYRDENSPNVDVDGGTFNTGGPWTLPSGQGSSVDLGTIPAGRVVTRIDAINVSGPATGEVYFEAKAARTI